MASPRTRRVLQELKPKDENSVCLKNNEIMSVTTKVYFYTIVLL